MSSEKIESISGGCLCGAIRYDVNFSHDFKWPPTSSTCQCTMCRKWTASLTAQFLIVPPTHITPALNISKPYKEYESSPGRFRGFCSHCGSSLIWRSETDTSTIDLFLGTLDEKWLVSKEEGSEGNTETVKALAVPSGTQFWMENAVPGVTDLVEGGQRFLRERPENRAVG